MFSNEFRRASAPYCIEKLSGGNWILLNRNFKPLGCAAREYVDYETFTGAIHARGLTHETMQELSWEPIEEDVDRIFLYSDQCIPNGNKTFMESYLKKITILLQFVRSPF